MPWALNLDQHAYPAFLNNLTLLSMREVGVPLKAGLGVGERAPSVATHVLALCEGPLSLNVGRPILCCPEMRETCVFHGLRRSSVTVVQSDVSPQLFESWDVGNVLGLDG